MRLLTISVLVLGLCGCAMGAAPQNTENPASSESPASPAGTESPSAELSVSEKPGAGPLDAPENSFAELSIPTLMTKIGDLWFICDCYHYDGSFDDAYLLGDPMTVTENMEISNVPVLAKYSVCFRFTDLYQQHYWTPVLEGN